MTKVEAQAGTAMLRAVLALLPPMAAPGNPSAAAELRRLCGAASVTAPTDIPAGAFAAGFSACFAAATAAGATFAGMSRVERFALGAVSTLSGNAATAVLVTALRLQCVQQARILAATTFTSRQAVEEAQTQVNASFESAVEYAADTGEAEAYRTLLALHAAVTRDLQQRSRPLPRITTYSMASLPSLTLAQSLYGDPSRADELRAENRAPHPLFMPPAGRALTA